MDYMPALPATSRGLSVQVSRGLYRRVVRGVRMVLLVEPTSDTRCLKTCPNTYVQMVRYRWGSKLNSCKYLAMDVPCLLKMVQD